MELNFKTFGQGPPLVILHGLFGTLDNWQTLAKRWATDYTVVLVDQRNHGRSPHLPVHDYPRMAEDLKAFLDRNWMYKVHLLGHSMGGKTAMQFALQHPEMVEKLVVVDITPKAYTGGHEVILEALRTLPIDEVTDRKMADAFLAQNIAEVGIRQFLLKNLMREKTGGYRWKMNLPVLLEYYPAILANIDSEETFDEPTLFIRGARSHYVQDSDWSGVLAYFPTAQLATVAAAGHWVHAEQPGKLFDLVAAFLAES
ncbi:MAG: alpha/beta fold hydrolase [Bacteroidota bacterium]